MLITVDSYPEQEDWYTSSARAILLERLSYGILKAQSRVKQCANEDSKQFYEHIQATYEYRAWIVEHHLDCSAPSLYLYD